MRLIRTSREAEASARPRAPAPARAQSVDPSPRREPRRRAPATRQWRELLAVAAIGLALLLAACSGSREDPILRLSATEALEQGKELLARGKYREARKYLLHAFEVEPNSAAGRDGLLLAADALFNQGGFDSLVEAETRYRDFINRFPTSPRADYAQFRVAVSLAERIEKPSRDQQTARKAVEAFDDLRRAFPTSRYLDEAAPYLAKVNDSLAEHEYYVAFFYYRYGRRHAAARRIEYLMEHYPQYGSMDKALALLCRCYAKLRLEEKAGETCQRARQEYPTSKHTKGLPSRFSAAGPKKDGAS